MTGKEVFDRVTAEMDCITKHFDVNYSSYVGPEGWETRAWRWGEEEIIIKYRGKS